MHEADIVCASPRGNLWQQSHFFWVPPSQQIPIPAVPVDKEERVGQEIWISGNNQL